jgi:hypothetical protein
MKAIKLLSFGTLLLIVAIAGCKRCMCCGPSSAYVIGFKGGDTLFSKIFSHGNLDDSLQYYSSFPGIDSSSFGYYPGYGPFAVCGPTVKRVESAGFVCSDGSDKYDPCF